VALPIANEVHAKGSAVAGAVNTQLPAEAQLAAEARDGSHIAYGRLVERYGEAVRRVVDARMGGGAADRDDVVQQTFAAAWADLPQLRSNDKFGAWITGIAVNLARRWTRDEARYREMVEAHGRPHDLLRDERRDAAGRWPSVRDSVEALPPDQRDAVTLHYLHGMSYAEIATDLALPVSTVLGRLQRARKRLREEHGPMTAQLRIGIEPSLKAFLHEHAASRGVEVGELVAHVLARYQEGIEAAQAPRRPTQEAVRVAPPAEMNAEEARDAVARFFDALLRRDYALADALTEPAYHGRPWQETSYAGVTDVVEIGQPYQEEDRRYAGGQGVFVPYSIVVAGSDAKSWRVAMRCDSPEGQWVFDGGL